MVHFSSENIHALKNVSENDKNYLLSLVPRAGLPSFSEICENLSLFSKRVSFKKLDEYEYLETQPDSNIFYIPSCKIFVDEDKKIILHSHISVDLQVLFFKEIDNVLEKIDKLDITQNTNIGENCIVCEKWFISYGHVLDEMFALFEFSEKLKRVNPTTFQHLQDYPIDQDLCKGYLVPAGNNNYNTIGKYLFGEKFFNLGTESAKCYSLKNLVVIKHNWEDPTFHKLPNIARNHILSKMPKNFAQTNKNIFITRTQGRHALRNLDNLHEIENFFTHAKYDVINPEEMNYDVFVHYVQNAENIFMTWGGIIVSLVYMKPDARVYILQSKSYGGEKLDIVGNMISHYSLKDKIQVIHHIDNKIDLNVLEPLI